MCTDTNLNLKLITSLLSVFLAGFENHQHVSNVGFCGCRGMTTELFVGLAKRKKRMLSQDSINVNLKTQVGRNLILSRQSLRKV